MTYLYLDNFRGFSDATIPLLDVNFLVGENSTGKTSLMNVFRMLSSERVLMGQEPSDEDYLQIGHFTEMVSAHSKDKSYFRLGFIGEARHPSRKQMSGYGMLLTYKNVGGLSQIACVTSTTMNGETTILFDGDDIFYKNVEGAAVADAKEMTKRITAWVETHKNSSPSDYEKLELPKGAPKWGDRKLPLLLVFMFAAQKAEGQKEFGVPGLASQTVWIAPIRTRPKRTYDEPQSPYSSEGAHIPYVIKRILSSKTDANKFRAFMKKIGKASGLFQKIEVRHFGKSGREAGPFEIDAYLDEKALGLHLMGYGVSQSLPIFVELLRQPKGSWYGIQQPEIHLHPKAQAALGDLFFEMATRDNKFFLIETHSDFAIDRFRQNYGKRGKRKAPQSQVLFFERRNKRNTVTQLPIGPDGKLPIDQPESYRSFFIREQMNLLGMK